MGRSHSHSHRHRRQQDRRFSAALTGAQEVPPVVTNAMGMGTFILDEKKRRLVYAIVFRDLSSPFLFAHFHLGAAGANGPVLEEIKGWTLSDDKTAGAVTAVWDRLPRKTMRAFKSNGVYVNVHSTNFPAGEIRGQVKALLM